jgi:hypothetical protein
MQNQRGLLGLFVTSVLYSTSVFSQSVDTPALAPFEGNSGYQEIAISPDVWYLAFHGTRQHSRDAIEAAFWFRAAQLCGSVNKSQVIELVFLGEKLFASDPEVADLEAGANYRQFVKGFIYIPIYIPTQRSAGGAFYETPSKTSAIRCLKTADGLLSSFQPKSIQEIFELGKKFGYQSP